MKAILENSKAHYITIMVFGFILYANTLTHDYTQDDAIVIYDNMFTTKGISGIPGLLTKDTFFGFFKEEGKTKLVAGGRYRPLTPIMFAIEYQFFGKKPWIGHLINVLLFGFLGCIIYAISYLLFIDIFPKDIKLLAFVSALIFIAHPIHTEVVANIKGRDEIMAMLGSLASFYFLLKHVEKPSIKYLIYAGLCFFLGILSKENTITFLAIVPLGLILFKQQKWTKSLRLMLPAIAATTIFLIIRSSILGFDMGGNSTELMNNPFLKWNGTRYIPFDSGEKLATIFYTLLIYLKLLIVPHPLTHDYYPRHIDIMSFSDITVLFSVLLNIGLVVLSFFLLKKNKFISYCIWFYFISLSIVSNIVFPIGTNMSERFLFMPSLAFAWFTAYLFLHGFRKKSTLTLAIGSVLLLLFSIKTVSRNMVWKDDYTLFTTDVKTSSNSAKLLNAAGGALSTTSEKLTKGPIKTKNLNQAIEYLNQAIEIHPTYKNAYLLRANSHYYLENYTESIQDYEKSLSLDPDYKPALKNLPIALRQAGRYFGEKMNDIPRALKYLKQAEQLGEKDPEVFRLMGISYGMQKNHLKAIEYFKKTVDLQPENAQGYVNLGIAYKNAGDEVSAQKQFDLASAIDPTILDQFNK